LRAWKPPRYASEALTCDASGWPAPNGLQQMLSRLAAVTRAASAQLLTSAVPTTDPSDYAICTETCSRKIYFEMHHAWVLISHRHFMPSFLNLMNAILSTTYKS
jgi:hypothetical protein